MRWLNRKIDKFGYNHPRFGIPNLMLWVVIGSIIVYLLTLIDRTGSLGGYLAFSPTLILRGQVWRLITFVLILPPYGNPLFAAISLYFYFFIGRTLEQQWGTPKFTLFYLCGVLFHIIGGFLVWAFAGQPIYIGLSAHYLNLSMFFAFASLYPNMQILLFFLIPIKMKWLAWLDAAYFLYGIIVNPFPIRLLPVIAILNYFLFFGADLIRSIRSLFGRRPSAKTVKFRTAEKAAKENRGYLHKCTVCGKTDTDYPDLAFRYCSKCNGYYCYCEDHIHNHVHIQ